MLAVIQLDQKKRSINLLLLSHNVNCSRTIGNLGTKKNTYEAR